MCRILVSAFRCAICRRFIFYVGDGGGKATNQSAAADQGADLSQNEVLPEEPKIVIITNMAAFS